MIFLPLFHIKTTQNGKTHPIFVINVSKLVDFLSQLNHLMRLTFIHGPLPAVPLRCSQSSPVVGLVMDTLQN